MPKKQGFCFLCSVFFEWFLFLFAVFFMSVLGTPDVRSLSMMRWIFLLRVEHYSMSFFNQTRFTGFRTSFRRRWCTGRLRSRNQLALAWRRCRLWHSVGTTGRQARHIDFWFRSRDFRGGPKQHWLWFDTHAEGDGAPAYTLPAEQVDLFCITFGVARSIVSRFSHLNHSRQWAFFLMRVLFPLNSNSSACPTATRQGRTIVLFSCFVLFFNFSFFLVFLNICFIYC